MTQDQAALPYPEAHPQADGPADQLNHLRVEISQLVDEFLRRPLARLASMAGDPALNLYRLEQQLILEAAVPGFGRSDLQVDITRDTLHIRAKRRALEHPENAQYFHRELRVQSLERRLHLPVEIDPEKSTAQLSDGLLKITMQIVDSAARKLITLNLI